VKAKRRPLLHLDVDTTVEPLFGNHEGALPGYNPRYQGPPELSPDPGPLRGDGHGGGSEAPPGGHVIRRRGCSHRRCLD
jgi:hypothetical protein